MPLHPDELVILRHLDPTDRDLAMKRARYVAELDLVGLDEYIKLHPTLDKEGFPIEWDEETA